MRLLPRRSSALLPRLAAAAAAGLLLAAIGIARAAEPPRYTAVDLGFYSGIATGINNAGEAAGSAYVPRDSGVLRPALFSGGSLTALSAGDGRATDVNNRGVTVGELSFVAPGTGSRAMVWTSSGGVELPGLPSGPEARRPGVTPPWPSMTPASSWAPPLPGLRMGAPPPWSGRMEPPPLSTPWEEYTGMRGT